MVTRAYLLKRPKAPSAAKLFFDQTVIPLAIDAVATVEAILERVANGTRQSPAAMLVAFAALGWALARKNKKFLLF